MKKFEKILGLGIIILAFLFGSIYIFLTLTGKDIIIKELQRVTGRKVTVTYFGLTPAFHLEVRGLSIEGMGRADAVVISPNLFTLFTGKLVFNNLKFIKPELTFSKNPPLVVDTVSKGSVISAPGNGKEKVEYYIPLAFKRIKVKDGKINFIDQTISSNGIKIVIKDINCSISNLYLYPRPVVTNFNLKAKIPWREGETQGQIELEGWVNYSKKDMRATLKIKDIDAIYLYPYYSTWVDLDKARIEKAKLNFSSEIHGLNNNVTAECHMELTDMVRKPLEPGETEEKASLITNKVLDMFKTLDQGKVELNFSIKTKMDSPQFGFNNFKTAFEDKITQGKRASGFKPEDALGFPVKLVEGGVRSFTDLGRAMIDGIFAIGSEISKSTGDAFKKDPVSLK
jgi:hypothetical protein